MMKISRLQNRLLVLILANIFLIAFLGIRAKFRSDQEKENRFIITQITEEIQEYETAVLDVEVILVDTEKKLEKVKAQKADFKNCLSSKILELGNQKIGATELDKLIQSCYVEAEF